MLGARGWLSRFAREHADEPIAWLIHRILAMCWARAAGCVPSVRSTRPSKAPVRSGRPDHNADKAPQRHAEDGTASLQLPEPVSRWAPRTPPTTTPVAEADLTVGVNELADADRYAPRRQTRRVTTTRIGVAARAPCFLTRGARPVFKEDAPGSS